MVHLRIGDKAPDFEAPSSAGRTISLKDYLWQKDLILFFYPADFTPGCTKEVSSLREGYGAIQREGADVLGVSLDGVESHLKFSNKCSIPFPLISDKNKAISKAYGVMGFLRSKRVTFVIGKDGRIAHILDKVNVSRHADEILNVLKALKASR